MVFDGGELLLGGKLLLGVSCCLGYAVVRGYTVAYSWQQLAISKRSFFQTNHVC